jgi:hypothetical protein
MLENSPQDRSPNISRSITNRSAVTNGAILPGVDGRSAWARRLRDLIELHVADLGGADNISEAEKAIVRRAATLICELERMEVEFAVAEGSSESALEVYQRAANSMRRLLESVGLQRRSRDVTPTLAEYLQAARAAAVDAEQDTVPSTDVSPRIAPDRLPGVPADDETAQREGST